ncbi:glycosyltransferase family 2 protein [Mesorhizobium japonicum]|uniref:glycosyltransferase family 2 protein n=1 Tax=Mesorhizobium japonicum TaxID=2066070 RepID=UPI003B5A24BC
MSTYNAECSVGAAIASALAQTWRPIEIVVVDDCSSDSTPRILRRLASVHPELRLFFNSVNSGVGATRNRILEESKGEFLAFFDDDDESLPNRIAEQYIRIVDYEKNYRNGELIVCHTARRLIYPNGETRFEPTMGQNLKALAPAGKAVAHMILMGAPLKNGNGSCPTCSQMARLSTYRSVGGFDPLLRRGEDTDFNIRIAIAGGHFVGIESALVIQNMTKTSDKSLFEEYRNNLILLEKHKSIIEAEGQYSFCREWLDIKFLWLDKKYFQFGHKLLALFFHSPLITIKRLRRSVPNFGLNQAFSKFHRLNVKR